MTSFERLITTRAATLRIELLQFLTLPELLKIALLSKKAYAFIDPNDTRFGAQEDSKVKLHLARLAFHYLKTVKESPDATQIQHLKGLAYFDHREVQKTANFKKVTSLQGEDLTNL